MGKPAQRVPQFRIDVVSFPRTNPATPIPNAFTLENSWIIVGGRRTFDGCPLPASEVIMLPY